MDELAAAAAAAQAADDAPAPALDPDDEARGDLESDEEEGPPEVDDDDDATPPGGLPTDAVDEDDNDAEEIAETAAAAAAPAGVPAADGPPDLPPDIKTLKVADLKVHLWWRKQIQSGNKPDLVARLQKAIDENVPLRGVEEAVNAPSGGVAQSAQWESLDSTKIERPVYTGSEKFVPNPRLGLTPQTHPFEYMNAFYPKKIRDLEVKNSEIYRGHVKTQLKEVYKGQPDITERTNSLAHGVLLVQGLNPVPDQRRMFSKSFAYKDHRTSDMLTRDEWCVWKAYFHVSDPCVAPKYGTKEWDELHKVRPMLEEYLKNCVANVTGGRSFSIDEITIGFQGHHARLKLRCGKFKRAGDGFQVHVRIVFYITKFL